MVPLHALCLSFDVCIYLQCMGWLSEKVSDQSKRGSYFTSVLIEQCTKQKALSISGSFYALPKQYYIGKTFVSYQKSTKILYHVHRTFVVYGMIYKLLTIHSTKQFQICIK